MNGLASALQIPTTGTVKDVRQLLDTKLMECGHEPMKVQVKVHTTDEETLLFLEDVNAIFLEVRPETEDDPEAKSTTSDGEVEEEQSIESLWQALHTARFENEALTKESRERGRLLHR